MARKARVRVVALARIAKPGGRKRPAVIIQVKRPGLFGKSTYHPKTFKSYAAREKFLHPKDGQKRSAKQLRYLFATHPNW